MLFLCENRVSINPGIAGIKHLNRLENVLARNEWHNKPGPEIHQAYADGIMLDNENRIIECTSSNIFTISDGRLSTPDLSLSGVSGVMREVTLEVAADIGIESSIGELSVEDMREMDEVFITNSLIGLKSIGGFLDTHYHEDGITSAIIKAIKASIEKHAHNL